MKNDCYYVYIMTNKPRGTLYIGNTHDIIKRIHEHKNHLIEGFTDRYNLTVLVHVEAYETLDQALQREQRLKKWKRDWKIQLVEEINPTWRDVPLSP